MLSTPVPASSPGTVAPRTVSFIACRDFAAGINPQSVVVGDFNGDGMLDLAVANAGSLQVGDGSVSVLLGNGDGTFQVAVNFAAGRDPRALAACDFNGDGVLDLAVTNGPSPPGSDDVGGAGPPL